MLCLLCIRRPTALRRPTAQKSSRPTYFPTTPQTVDRYMYLEFICVLSRPIRPIRLCSTCLHHFWNSPSGICTRLQSRTSMKSERNQFYCEMQRWNSCSATYKKTENKKKFPLSHNSTDCRCCCYIAFRVHRRSSKHTSIRYNTLPQVIFWRIKSN